MALYHAEFTAGQLGHIAGIKDHPKVLRCVLQVGGYWSNEFPLTKQITKSGIVTAKVFLSKT